MDKHKPTRNLKIVKYPKSNYIIKQMKYILLNRATYLIWFVNIIPFHFKTPDDVYIFDHQSYWSYYLWWLENLTTNTYQCQVLKTLMFFRDSKTFNRFPVLSTCQLGIFSNSYFSAILQQIYNSRYIGRFWIMYNTFKWSDHVLKFILLAKARFYAIFVVCNMQCRYMNIHKEG